MTLGREGGAMATDLPRLDEIRALLPELPGPDLQAKAAAQARQAEWMKPAADLGRLAETALWLATWQGARPPRMERPRLAIFAANHGVAALGACDEDSGYSHRMVQYFIVGGAAVNQLAAMLDADLRVYEMALDQPTADFTQGPAMSDEDCARALSYGMMAVEEGFDLMALGEVGLGSTTSAAALCHGLFGGAAADWVAGDSGCDEAMTARRLAVVQRGVAVNQTAFADPFEVLRCLGGLELSALVGAIIACRLAQIPVLLDSFASAAAAAVLHAFEIGRAHV